MYRVLVGKPEGRPKRRWDNDIKTDLQKVEWEGMDWFDLAHDWNRW